MTGGNMKTQVVGIALLYIVMQLGCYPVGDAQQTSVANQESKPYALPTGVSNIRSDPDSQNLDLRNFSQIRDVEMTQNGLLVLTYFSNSGSFTMFLQDGDSWSKISSERFRPVPDGDRGSILCVDFVNGENGWAIGYEMDVWRTNDGARTWSRIGKIPEKSPAKMCEGFQFTSLRTGWLTDFNGLYKTTDGGETWSRVRGISVDAQKVVFLDQLTGWVSAVNENNNSTLYSTSDGGSLWISHETSRVLAIDEIYPQTSLQG